MFRLQLTYVAPKHRGHVITFVNTEQKSILNGTGSP